MRFQASHIPRQVCAECKVFRVLLDSHLFEGPENCIAGSNNGLIKLIVFLLSESERSYSHCGQKASDTGGLNLRVPTQPSHDAEVKVVQL